MVEHKDVVLAILAAASATGALILVFFGLLVAQVQSFPAGTLPSVLLGSRLVASWTAAVFVVSATAVGTAVWWLTGTQSPATYTATVLTFLIQLLGMIPVIAWILWAIVWAD